MEKITISRIGQEKTIEYINKKTNQPDSFKKVGVQTNEYGERWIDITFRGEVPVKVGQSYEGELKDREYNGKTYYDFELPRTNRAAGAGMSSEQFQKLHSEVFATRQEVVMIRQLLQEANLIPSARPVAAGVEYPASTGPSAFDESPPFKDEDFPQF